MGTRMSEGIELFEGKLFEQLDRMELRIDKIQTMCEDINEKVDLLTIRKQVDRSSKEKAIKEANR